MRVAAIGGRKTKPRGFVTRYYRSTNNSHENYQASGFPSTKHGALKGAVPRIAMSKGNLAKGLPFETYAKAVVFDARTGAIVYSIKWHGAELKIVYFGDRAIRLVSGG